MRNIDEGNVGTGQAGLRPTGGATYAVMMIPAIEGVLCRYATYN
jgi:hypothetical protein